MEITQPIVNVRGEVIANPGQIINPLEVNPTQLRIVVFDATKNDQMEWAKRTLNELPYGKMIAVTTQLKHDKRVGEPTKGKGWLWNGHKVTHQANDRNISDTACSGNYPDTREVYSRQRIR